MTGLASSAKHPMTRRAWLGRASLASLGAGMSGWLALAEGRAQGGPAPRRLMLMTRPNGTIYEQWMPANQPEFQLPSASAPFEPLRGQMTLFDNLDLILRGADPLHESNMVCLLTGGPVDGLRPAPNDWMNVDPSIDQHLNTASVHFQNHKPLYLAADGRVDNRNPQVANRAIAYTGRDEPVFPELQPSVVYQRVFAGLMPGGATEANQEALEAARREQRSVLDFVSWDLKKLTDAAPVQERDQLDRHASLIRELEMRLDETPEASCEVPTEPDDVRINVDGNIGIVGQQHLDIVRAAFSCDLARQVMFMWTAAASSAQWSNLYEGMPTFNHHALSHRDLGDSSVWRPLAAIDQWYSEQTSLFLQSLQSTPDVDGLSLLENTLVVYASPIRDGSHSPRQIPVALFGGEALGHSGNRIFDAQRRPMNDLWLAIADKFEAPLDTLGSTGQTTGPMDGVFG